MTDKINNLLENNNCAYMAKDQLNGLNIAVGDSVEMGSIVATVDDIDYVDSHNCWVVRFSADGKSQEVPATQVIEAVASGKMVKK